jgi:hypothetical protein
MPVSRSVFWIAAAVCTALAGLPLFLVAVPPLVDYPAHLVRMTMLAATPLDPLLARAWTIELRPLANLAMDLVVPLIAPLTGPDVGLKLFVTLGLGLWIAGAGLLGRAVWREWSVWPLFAAFFAVNGSFFDGYFNYSFGVGLALVTAGCWALPRRRGPAVRLLVAGLAVAVMVCHLMAYAVLALILGGLALGRLSETERDGRRPGLSDVVAAVIEVAMVLAPAALLWLFVVEHGPGGPTLFRFEQNLLGLVNQTSAFAGTRHNAAPITLLAAAALLARTTGRLRIARPLLPAAALMLIASLAVPSEAFGGAGIHARLPAVVAVLALVAVRIEMPAPLGRRLLPGLALVLLAVVLLAGGLVQAARWRDGAATIDRFRAAIRLHLPEGTRLAASIARPDDVDFWHVADLAVIDRHAFVPTLFATPGQSPLRLTPAFAPIGAGNAREGGALLFRVAERHLGPTRVALTAEETPHFRVYRDLACDFDYLALFGPAPPRLPPALHAVATDPAFALYRIEPAPERGCIPR